MCTRFFLTAPLEALQTQFSARGGIPHPARYNIAPTQPVVIVRRRPAMEALPDRELTLVRWGLIPHWVKAPRDFATLVTARAETALEKPSYKTPMRHRRCIVPANGWYAWRGKPGDKQAYMLRPKVTDPSALALAGLWDHWLGADGSEMETLAILTVPANADVGAIDDRMPVILSGAAIDAWLDVRGTCEVEALELLRAAEPPPLEPIAIRSAVNNPDAEGAGLQTPSDGSI
jgi:putative SOS response-associated peptidase YedK